MPGMSSLQKQLVRPSTTDALPSNSQEIPSFVLGDGHRSYKHQFANIYFVRLRLLRPFVEQRARERWSSLNGSPVLIPRVLDVVKSQLCYIIGTVYMDMPLKPNVLEDIGRDNSIPAPPVRSKFYSSDDAVMLEDESGRIQLVGKLLTETVLVTGVIMAALGLETATGEFEVVDICFAGMAPQARIDEPAVMNHNAAPKGEGMDVDVAVDPSASEGEWIGLVSGLDFGSQSSSDAQIQMLVEYLTSESGGLEDQQLSSRISRIIIAGNSISAEKDSIVPATSTGDVFAVKKSRRYGQETTSLTSHATQILGGHLLDIAQAMPIHILAGETDPSGILLPQQPFPRAMFGAVKDYGTFSCETNPAWLGIGGRTLLVNSGQPLSDMYKYLPSPPMTRLSIATSTLHWRHMAPTAPDTLWCYPYFTTDPFILQATPDLYVIGNQPRFQTKLVHSEDRTPGDAGEAETRCRIVLLPIFAETGILVLVNLRTLEVRTVKLAVEEHMKVGGA